MTLTKNQIWWTGLATGAVTGAVVAVAVTTFVVRPAEVGHCSGAECQIHIVVNDCAKGDIEATPDPARISVAKNIKWTIDTRGYMFTENGIQITGTDFTPDPGLMPSEGGNKWRIRDAHINNLGENKYTIEVKTSAGVVCKKKDPYIFND